MQTRRRISLGIGGAVGVLLLVASGFLSVWVLGSAEGDFPDEVVQEGPAASPESGPTAEWEPIADSPLPARYATTGAWTGEEMLVVGGREGPPCPPGADCVDPSGPTTDAAAYDPATDTWRVLPDAPRAVSEGVATWTGKEVVVVSRRLTLAFDPTAGAEGTWHRPCLRDAGRRNRRTGLPGAGAARRRRLGG